MFEQITPAMRQRMRALEEIDAHDRTDGTPRSRRRRLAPPESGRFIAILAATAPPGDWIEVGASAGCSTLWLSLAARERGVRLTTYEIDPAKIALAQDTFALTGAGDVITIVHGDVLQHIPEHAQIGFCFLDAEQEVYTDAYELAVRRLAPGGLLLADNAISHQEELQPLIDRALADDRVDALVVPIGSGELVCRRRALGPFDSHLPAPYWRGAGRLKPPLRDRAYRRGGFSRPGVLRLATSGRESKDPTPTRPDLSRDRDPA